VVCRRRIVQCLFSRAGIAHPRDDTVAQPANADWLVPPILVSVRAGRLVVRLPTAMYFESGKAELQPEGKAVLDAIAPLLAGMKDRRFQRSCRRCRHPR
jgi:outer membrane protein OmpA-like peptidoglycan-associated protein